MNLSTCPADSHVRVFGRGDPACGAQSFRPRTLLVAFVAIKCLVEYLGNELEQSTLKSIGLEEPA